MVASQRRFRTLHREPGILVGELGPLCVVIWRGEVTRERFAHQRAGLAHVVARNPGKAGFMCVVEPQVKPPSEELRARSAEMMREHGASLPFVAGVIEARGFMGSLTRSVMSAMQLLSRRKPTSQAFFASIAEASAWLAERLDMDAQELEELVAQKRDDQTGTGLFRARGA
ncbi:MAG: hypothetical protein ABW352_15325 [Polyangiales bacterium]